jgi:hypothetical protein
VLVFRFLGDIRDHSIPVRISPQLKRHSAGDSSTFQRHDDTHFHHVAENVRLGVVAELAFRAVHTPWQTTLPSYQRFGDQLDRHGWRGELYRRRSLITPASS